MLLLRLLLNSVECRTLSQIPQRGLWRQHLSTPMMKKEVQESEQGKVQTSLGLKEESFPHTKSPLVSSLAVKERRSLLRAM